jgi:hypothetical protein
MEFVMKALALSFAVFVVAASAATTAEAHFHGFFHPGPRIGLSRGHMGPRDENRQRRQDRGGLDGDIAAYQETPYDAAPDASPRYVPVPVAVPYRVTVWTPSQPRLILIGDKGRPSGKLPGVVYGDPLPEKAAAAPEKISKP